MARRVTNRLRRRPRGVTSERWIAWRIVHRTMHEGAWADRIFDAECARVDDLTDGARRSARYLAWGTIEQAKLVDHVIATVGRRPIARIDAPLLNALRLGMFQLLVADGIAEHATVDQTVELVRGTCGERPVAFANAVMRRAQVDGERIIGRLDPRDIEDQATLASIPAWMLQLAREERGEAGIDDLVAQSGQGMLRAGTWYTPAASTPWDADVEPWAWIHTIVPELVIPPSEQPLPADDRQAWPMAPGSALAGVLAADPQARVIIDMCAAPGGKTRVLADRCPDAQIIAIEADPARAVRLRERMDHAGAGDRVRVIEADATGSGMPDDLPVADVVLVDAPCTGTGILAARPDLRWKRTRESVDELASLQQRLLTTAVGHVRPGGRIVYSTCSILEHENEHVVRGVIASGACSEVKVDPRVPDSARSEGSETIRVSPHVHRTDGLTITVLERRA